MPIPFIIGELCGDFMGEQCTQGTRTGTPAYNERDSELPGWPAAGKKHTGVCHGQGLHGKRVKTWICNLTETAEERKRIGAYRAPL